MRSPTLDTTVNLETPNRAANKPGSSELPSRSAIFVWMIGGRSPSLQKPRVRTVDQARQRSCCSCRAGALIDLLVLHSAGGGVDLEGR
jgi:hypothetical protein